MYDNFMSPALAIVAIALGAVLGWRKSFWIAIPTAAVCGAASFFFEQLDGSTYIFRVLSQAAAEGLRSFAAGIVISVLIKVFRSM